MHLCGFWHKPANFDFSLIYVLFNGTGRKLGEMMVDFVQWFQKTEPGQRFVSSVMILPVLFHH